MKANKEITPLGHNLALVPYQEHHVSRYHGWMQDPVLREQTASEALSLEEEYEMQQKWQNDEDKLTFIIVAASAPGQGLFHTQPEVGEALLPSDTRLRELTPIGDVNIFFHGSRDKTALNDSDEEFQAELEVMIAEPAYRRRGYAIEALCLMLSYATGLHPSHFTHNPKESLETKLPSLPNPIPVAALIARISDSNTPSIRLFEKLGFTIKKHVQIFGEVEMRWGS